MMDYKYEDLIDENLVNQCDQIRSIAKKSWLSSAGVSLATLDNVKATVYNVGLTDPRDLKALNLRDKKTRVVNNPSAEPPLSTVSLQQTAKICGSNSSIPDLIRQHSNDRLHKPTRPASASTRKPRPPSGRKERPQSAKESPSLSTAPNVSVKGAKCEPSGRPPKGVPSGTTTGWVGPPAGLKYPDRPPSGQSWKLEFPDEPEPGVKEAPPPPHGTPVPPSSSPEPEEHKENKTKRVFELFIGDPYKTGGTVEDELFEDSDSDFGPLSPVAQPPPPVLLRKPNTPESLRLSLPTAEDEESGDEMDTDRLLQEAEMVTKKLDLQSIIKLNKVVEPTDSSSNSKKCNSGPTGHINKCSDASSNNNKVSSKLVSSASHKIPTTSSAKGESMSAHHENESESRLFVQSPMQVFDSFDDILIDVKIEDEVSTMIGDENKDSDNKCSNHEADDLRQDNRLGECSEQHTEHNERKGIIHEHRQKTDLDHEHEKTNVKFSEDKNTTVDITPRNLGRKVTELIPNKKKKAPNDSFVDLIEVKNRIEPILQAGKVAISPRDVLPPKRPPSGKLRNANSSSQKSALNDKKQSNVINQRPGSGKIDMRTNNSSVCSKLQTGRPRSAPLNRAVSPITTVLVDYGDDEKSNTQNGDNSKTEAKPKKKRNRNKDDVETIMQKLGISECDSLGDLNNTSNNKTTDFGNESDKSFKSDDNFAKFDTNTGILTATVCKSEPVKNYYEVARHSATPNKDKGAVKVEEISPVYKTTKTIEFDEAEPKEMSVKTVIDPVLVPAKENERLRSTTPERGRPASRASSHIVTKKPPKPSEGCSDSLERPGSRMGFVAMTPDKSPSERKKDVKKRPSSAPVNRHQKAKDNKSTEAGKTELTEKEKAERDKVIDNLLERTKTLLGENENTAPNETKDKKTIRPTSAYTGISGCKHDRQVKSAGVRRPTSAKTSIHRRAVSAKTPRKSSGKKRTVVTEPCIITTNTSFENDETEEDMLCQQMERDLNEKGVNVTAETLQRALYPPSGRTKYYRLTADLPRSNSLTLLSHPKTWLPQEYKKLQRAEKTLSQANEMMYLQHKAELRRAKLAELGPEAVKKLKKKGKKGGKKLRRSKSFG